MPKSFMAMSLSWVCSSIMMRCFSFGTVGSVVVTRTSDIGSAECCSRICVSCFDRDGALHALLEHGLDGAVMRRSDVKRSRTSEFQALIAEAVRETQDSER